MPSLARVIAGYTGWRRLLLAALLGAMAAAALPPVYAVPLLIPAFVGLLWLMESCRNWRGAVWIGWWFGLGHFAAGTYWISLSLLVDAAKFAWLVPFAVVGISAYLALFPALATGIVYLGRTRGLNRVLLLAAAWAATEWLRGVLFEGFSWNLLGTAWSFSDSMMQIASVTGVLGVSLATVVAAALPAIFADEPCSRGSAAARGMGLLVAAVMLAGIWAFGWFRLASAEIANVPGVTLRIVQPNIAQKNKWRRDLINKNFSRLLSLSAGPGFKDVTHVIWPEAAVPISLATSAKWRSSVAAAAPPKGLVITGAPRTTKEGERPFRIWNSLYAVAPNGNVEAGYDKHHLVPFGEYMPLRDLLNPLGISKVTAGAVDFSAGPGPVTLHLPSLPPAGPLICYEVIFPGRVLARNDRPAWLLNLTNDAWFGRSSGPYQHFASTRWRAVEEGLPLVRAANTGISAMVDPYGRVSAEIGLDEAGVIDARLPAALKIPTFFAEYGNWTVAAIIFLLGSSTIVLERINRNKT